MKPWEHGRLGEASAVEWLTRAGATIAIPVGRSPDWDVIAEVDGWLHRVQVKTSTAFRNDRWQIAVCTRGGNRSWNGTVKLFSASRCDYLFVVVADGRRWFIPASAVEAGTSIALGGEKYAEFEVERGAPLRPVEWA